MKLKAGDKVKILKKSDLKQGALVQMRNGNVYILIGKKFVNLKDGGYMPLEKYNEDLLTCNSIIGPIYDVVSNSKYDVMKVFNSSFEHHGYHTYINGYSFEWTWERKEEEPSKELTVGEIEKLLGYKVKIVKENEGNK
jgi:hypothetical protein